MDLWTRNLLGHPGALLHNWQEEQQRNFEALHEFLHRRSLGQLEIQRHQQKIMFHTKPVASTPKDSPFITFDTPVQFEVENARLSANLNAQQSSALATASFSPASKGTYRTCFQLRPATTDGASAGASWLSQQRDRSILHYGEKFSISMGEPLTQLSLSSLRTMGMSQQPVHFGAADTQDSIWQVVPADPVQKELCLGLPVAVGDLVGLVHQSSGHLLCRERLLADTEFGVESPISVRTALTPARRAVCQRNAQGDILGELGPRMSSENCWKIISGGGH